MKNKTTVTETSPVAAQGIEPDIDGTYDSHVIDLLDVDPMKHKIAVEHKLRDLTEKWYRAGYQAALDKLDHGTEVDEGYWRGYNDALDKVMELIKK